MAVRMPPRNEKFFTLSSKAGSNRDRGRLDHSP